METKVCENCGLPSWAVSEAGRSIQIEKKAENRYRRTARRTVWCCRDECAIQCLGVSKYGRATHKWPITLAQFRATNPLEAADAEKPKRGSLEYRQARMRVRSTMPTAEIGAVAC